MKYSITIDNVTTEFTNVQSAEMYASSSGVDVSVITEIPEETPVTNPSSPEVFEQKLAAGYQIPNTPYVLAMQDADRAQFTGMLILIKELLDKGYITGDTPQNIQDMHDHIITLTTDQFRTMMIGYGMYYKQIWDECDPKA